MRLLDSDVPAIRRATDNVEAYKLYLKGRYYWERRNRGALQNAITYFEQAISADPNYALAHAGLADCYVITGVYSIRPTREVHPRALSLAMRAVELDPELAEAHASLGAVKHFLEGAGLAPMRCIDVPLTWTRASPLPEPGTRVCSSAALRNSKMPSMSQSMR